MASPAAPSPGAPPSAQPAPGTPANVAAPSTTTAKAAPAAAPATRAKPVRLPGVIPDDAGPDDFFPPPPAASSGKRATEPSPSDAAPTDGPTRGPDGRFVAGTAATSLPPESADAAGDHAGQPDPTKAPAPAGRFKFAGEEFESQAVAEQNFRSLRGQFKPLQAAAARAAEHEARLAQAAESARGWNARALALEAELAGRKTAAPEADAPPESSQPDIDWGLYAEIKRLATESGEAWKAEQWLISETRKVERARLESLLDERLKPVREKEAREAIESQTEDLFGSLAGYTLSDGTPAFPELHDPVAALEVGRLWARTGLPPEHALTPQGAVAAVALYRMSKSGGSQGSSPRSNATVAPSTPTPQALAAAGVDDGRPSVGMTGHPGNEVGQEAARILNGLKQVGMQSRQRSVLGFDA